MFPVETENTLNNRQEGRNEMAANHRLTSVLQGRTISGTQNQGGRLIISFADGSHISVKTSGSSNSAGTVGTIRAARQAGTTLTLDMVDGYALSITTAGATSSVVVRNQSGAMEYSD